MLKGVKIYTRYPFSNDIVNTMSKGKERKKEREIEHECKLKKYLLSGGGRKKGNREMEGKLGTLVAMVKEWVLDIVRLNSIMNNFETISHAEVIIIFIKEKF